MAAKAVVRKLSTHAVFVKAAAMLLLVLPLPYIIINISRRGASKTRGTSKKPEPARDGDGKIVINNANTVVL